MSDVLNWSMVRMFVLFCSLVVLKLMVVCKGFVVCWLMLLLFVVILIVVLW